MSQLFIPPFGPVFQLNGTFAGAATLTFYVTQTTTKAKIFDESGAQLGNPITADAFGRFPSIYLDPATPIYRVVLKDKTGATIPEGDIDPYENLEAVVSAALSFTQIAPNAVARTVQTKLREISLSAKDYGAVGDGVTDDWRTIQNAVDAALYNNIPYVDLPAGTYLVSKTIQLGYGVEFTTVVLRGQGGYGADASRGSGRTRIISNFSDRPIVNIQGGRNSGIDHVWVDGVNQVTVPWSVSLAAAATPANYVYSGAATSPTAPFCAVAIDAYSGATPATPYPTPTYPSWMTPPGSAYGRNTSSGCFVTNCFTYRTVVGIAVQPNSPTANGDFMDFENTQLGLHQVGISYGNVNARNNNYSNVRFSNCYTMIDSVTYRDSTQQQRGTFAGNLANISADHCYQIFNVDLNWSYSSTVINFYMENCMRIGQVAGVNSGIHFTGCSFGVNDFMNSGTTITEEYSTYIIDNPASVRGDMFSFEACDFNGRRTSFPFQGVPKFSNCDFTPTAALNTAFYRSTDEQNATTKLFNGLILFDDLGQPSGTAYLRNVRLPVVLDAQLRRNDSADNSFMNGIHGRGMDTGCYLPYQVPMQNLRGDIGSGALASRTASGAGFTCSTALTYFQTGDVILTANAGRTPFYLATQTGSGPYTQQWNALTNYRWTSGGGYVLLDTDITGSPYYYPLGLVYAPNTDRYLKTTAGSPAVSYVDVTGTAQNVGSNFTTSRKLLWHGLNSCSAITPAIPFAANIAISTISGSTITMSGNAAISGLWLDAPGFCLITLG